jgi:isoleucyl-tRNA synthetase
VELSAIYLDVLKDRLYVSKADSRERRSAQSTLYDLLLGLTLAMAPILSFTADEIWEHIPGTGRPASVHLGALPGPPPGFPDEALLDKYDFLLKVRGEINRALEEARQEKRLATAQEAAVILATMDPQLYGKLETQVAELQTLAQVAELRVESQALGGPETQEIPGLHIAVQPAAGEKCVRCWFRYPGVGDDPDHPQVCARCRRVLEA